MWGVHAPHCSSVCVHAPEHSLRDRCKDSEPIQPTTQTGRSNRGREDECRRGKIQNEICFLWNWSRSSLTLPPDMSWSSKALKFLQWFIAMTQINSVGVGWNRCLVWSVAGFTAVPLNKKEKGGKKDKEMEKDLWLVAWSLKGETPWRDQSLISAISSTLGTPTSQRCVCLCVSLCVCAASGLRKQWDKKLLPAL